MYLLEFTEGPRAGQKLILRKKSASLGRAEEADVVLDGTEISLQQAEIQLRNNRAYLLNLDAQNPVQVNGEPITELELRDEDLLHLGLHQARYRRIDPPMPLISRPMSLLQSATSGAVGTLLALQMVFLILVSLLWRQSGLSPTSPAPAPKSEEGKVTPAALPKPKPKSDKGTTAAVQAASVEKGTTPVPANAIPIPQPPSTPGMETGLLPPRPLQPTPTPLVPPVPDIVRTPTPPQVVPEAPPTLIDQALKEFSSGDFIAAEQSIAKLLKQNPRDGEALALKARILDRQGKFREAQLTWETLVAISETPALTRLAQVEGERLLKMQKLMSQSQAMADRVRAEEKNSPLQAISPTTPDPTLAILPPAAPPVSAPLPPTPVSPPVSRPSPLSTRSVLLESAQIERLVGTADVEDMRMLTVNLKVDPASGFLQGEDVRIKTVFYDQDRQTRKVEPSGVQVLESNATLTGNLRPMEQISITRPYVVPTGFRRTQQERTGKALSFYGFVIEIYYRGRLLQQYARPSSLLSQ